jgi:hypothetical protein
MQEWYKVILLNGLILFPSNLEERKNKEENENNKEIIGNETP